MRALPLRRRSPDVPIGTEPPARLLLLVTALHNRYLSPLYFSPLESLLSGPSPDAPKLFELEEAAHAGLRIRERTMGLREWLIK